MVDSSPCELSSKQPQRGDVVQVTHEEILEHINNRRANAVPLFQVPKRYDLRNKSEAELFILSLLLRRNQYWGIAYILRCSKRPEIKARRDYRNHLPHVATSRKAKRFARYHGDEVYRRETNRKGVEFFKANKVRIYARIKARKPITQERDRKYIREWQRGKRQTDPQYNVGNRLRSRMWHALVDGKGKKAAKTESLIGCTIAVLRSHIEKQFTDGMSWERLLAGEIHLDHRRPCASFDLTKEEEQRRCFHWSNIQPLWARDNLSKGDKLLDAPPASA